MFGKVVVKGEGIHPLFAYLTKQSQVRRRHQMELQQVPRRQERRGHRSLRAPGRADQPRSSQGHRTTVVTRSTQTTTGSSSRRAVARRHLRSRARASTTSRTSRRASRRTRSSSSRGPSGQRQVVARVRHALRRGAAALRREPLVVRAAVPRADGQAQVRHDPGLSPDDRDRAEERVEQPALDRRHGHRGLRLLARALRARRACSTVTTAAAASARRPPEQIVRRSLRRCPRARSCVLLAPVARGARASTRRHGRRAAARVLRACASTAAWSTSPTGRRGSTRSRSTTSSSSSIASSSRSPSAPRITDSVEAALSEGRGRSSSRTSDKDERVFSQRNACESCGISFPELTPAELLVQLAHRRVHRVQRPRLAPRDGRGPRRHRAAQVDQGRRDQRVGRLDAARRGLEGRLGPEPPPLDARLHHEAVERAPAPGPRRRPLGHRRAAKQVWEGLAPHAHAPLQVRERATRCVRTT